jgi:hypothetical protein
MKLIINEESSCHFRYKFDIIEGVGKEERERRRRIFARARF